MEFTGRTITFSLLVLGLFVGSHLFLSGLTKSTKGLVDPATQSIVYSERFPYEELIVDFLGIITIYVYSETQSLVQMPNKKIVSWADIIKDKSDTDLITYLSDNNIDPKNVVFKRMANHKSFGAILELTAENNLYEKFSFHIYPYENYRNDPTSKYRNETRLINFYNKNADAENAHRILRNAGRSSNLIDQFVELKNIVDALPEETKKLIAPQVDKIVATKNEDEYE